MEKDIAEDLISYKKRNIQEQINKILNRWNETEASAFLEKAKNNSYFSFRQFWIFYLLINYILLV